MNIMLPINIEETKKQTQGKTVDLSQVIRNLTGIEQDAEKKSLIQQILEPKEVEDSQRDARKALEIARRIARGGAVSPAEKNFLMRVDPRLAQMAELARQEGQRIKHALEQASTREEQQTIVQQAYQMVTQVSKSNEQFGMLLGEAVKAAVQESQKKAPWRSELFMEEKQETGDITLQQRISEKKGDLQPQEMLLEQFFPEEWVSVMDCRG